MATIDEFQEILDQMKEILEEEADRIRRNDDYLEINTFQRRALDVVKDTAFQMADNGEVFEV